MIFRTYTLDIAGEIVGELFPAYFLFCLFVPAAALIVFLLFFPDRHAKAFLPSLVLLIVAVAASLYVSLKLHPEMRKVKQEIVSFESTSPDDLLRKTFRSLHAQSAVLNLVLLSNGIALLVMGASMRR